MGIRNPFIILEDGRTVRFSIFTKKNGVLSCLIDLKDFNRIKDIDIMWHARWSETANTFYIQGPCGRVGQNIQLHRVIMNVHEVSWKKVVVDHLNHNGLDNRRENLQLSSKRNNHVNIRRMNPRNTSGYRGVSYDKRREKFFAQAREFGSMKFLGYANTAKEASKLYEKYKNDNNIRDFIE